MMGTGGNMFNCYENNAKALMALKTGLIYFVQNIFFNLFSFDLYYMALLCE